MDKKDENDDKALDWAVLIGSILFIGFGLAAPLVLFWFGDIDIRDWTLDHWHPYVAVLCFVVYFAIGKVIIDIRKDNDEN